VTARHPLFLRRIYNAECHEGEHKSNPLVAVSDVDRVQRFRLTLRFFDDVSTAS